MPPSRHSLFAALTTMLLSSSAAAQPKGLQGLGAPGGLVQKDPKALTFELDVLNSLNEQRRRLEQPSLTMDERLRGFARRQAESAARGEAQANAWAEAIKQQGLAPYGYYFQYSAGPSAKALLNELLGNAAARAALADEFALVGVGAFHVPAQPPYFQVALLLTKVPDPMAGKPGLSTAQTDPVMQGAAERIKKCYDKALETNPNLRGDMLLEVVIGAEGRPDSVKLVKGLGQVTLDACALEVGKALQFPKPYKGKPVTLRHPLRFTPPQGERVVGKLSPTQINEVFRAAQADWRACYDPRVKQDPELRGDVVLALTVGGDGAVLAVDVKSDTLRDDVVRHCVLKHARTLRFARPQFGGEVDLTYPLSFAPGL